MLVQATKSDHSYETEQASGAMWSTADEISRPKRKQGPRAQSLRKRRHAMRRQMSQAGWGEFYSQVQIIQQKCSKKLFVMIQ